MRAIALSLLIACAPAFAQTEAYSGIAADGVGTAWGLAAGGTELNPLGWWTIPLRIGAVTYASSLPDKAGQPIVDAVSAASWGAVAGLIALPVGAAVGLGVWLRGSDERDRWAACRRHKQIFPDTANLPCKV